MKRRSKIEIGTIKGAVLLLMALAIVLVGCSDCEVKISTAALPPGTVGQQTVEVVIDDDITSDTDSASKGFLLTMN